MVKFFVLQNYINGFQHQFKTNVSCLFTFLIPMSAVCLHYGTIVSCLFTLILRMSAVCLQSYPMTVAVYLHLSYESQLIVYIMLPMSAVCLHLTIARFARNVRK